MLDNDKDHQDTLIKVLRQKGKRQKPLEKHGRFNVGTSITKRPQEVKGISTFGHWELDTVVSSHGQSKSCVATFVERKTRWYKAIKMVDRSAASMEGAIPSLNNLLSHGSIVSSTTDRGKEFSCYQVIEKSWGSPSTSLILFILAKREQRKFKWPLKGILP